MMILFVKLTKGIGHKFYQLMKSSPIKFRFIWPSGFRGEDLKKLANQKQELPVVAMLVNGSGQNVQSLERTFYRCFLPSFSSFG
jgi:hypothetical protein